MIESLNSTISANIDKTLTLFFSEGDYREIRAFNVYSDDYSPRASYVALVNDKDFIRNQIVDWDTREAKGIYFSMNPIDREAVGIEYLINNENRMAAGLPAADRNISRRDWILIDIDPERDTDTSSTDDEHYLASVVAKRVAKFLKDRGWPLPVIADSGNGFHLLYRAEDDRKIDANLSTFLKALSYLFNTDNIKIDTTVYNPSRITRFYGTKTRKGEDTKDRPHRYSCIDYVPETIIPITFSNLEPIISMLPAAAEDTEDGVDPAKAQERFTQLDLWIRQHKLTLRGPYPWGKRGRKWVFPTCPFDANHVDDSAFIVQFGSGAIYCGCLHKSCAGNNWKTLKEKFGPLFEKSRIGDEEKVLLRLGATNDTLAVLPQPDAAQKTKIIPAGRYPLTDMGNASRFAYLYGSDLRYVRSWNRWLVWNGSRWIVDPVNEVETRCKATIRAIRMEGTNAASPALADQTFKWALQSQGISHLLAVKTLGQTEEPIAAPADVWDINPLLINCKNGTYDLESDSFRPHSKDDYCTKMSLITYDADATCPLWERFLHQIMEGDPDKISYLQRVFGYAMTGLTDEQVMFIFIGVGKNGKSTLVETVQHILGSYAKVGASDLLTTAKIGESKHPAAIADLQGSRLVACQETDKGTYLAEGQVKTLTGEKRIKARFMGKDWFEFPVTHKIFLSANHRPVVRGSDEGIWRRLQVLPFNHVVPVEERDRNMGFKLMREASGIFNWMLKGYREWAKQGLNPPSDVTAAVKDYRDSMDVLSDFITEMCEVGPKKKVLLADIYDAYSGYTSLQNDRPVSNRKLKEMLEERRFMSKRGEKGMVISGITLKVSNG